MLSPAPARWRKAKRLANTPAGKLSDLQWGWIISAAIFAWIKTRYRQAIAEGLASEEHVTRMEPSPRDSAIVQSILPMLADQAAIDWSKPLAGWSKQEMAGFIGLAMATDRRGQGRCSNVRLIQSCRNPIGSSMMTSLSECPAALCADASSASRCRRDPGVALDFKGRLASARHALH